MSRSAHRPPQEGGNPHAGFGTATSYDLSHSFPFVYTRCDADKVDQKFFSRRGGTDASRHLVTWGMHSPLILGVETALDQTFSGDLGRQLSVVFIEHGQCWDDVDAALDAECTPLATLHRDQQEIATDIAVSAHLPFCLPAVPTCSHIPPSPS